MCVHHYSDGKVMLPLPSIEVLSEAATRSDRRGTVIHIMETSVISWMKQVKVGHYYNWVKGNQVTRPLGML